MRCESSKKLRLRFDDDFDDYPDSINIRPDPLKSSDPRPVPFPENNMTSRQKRRERQRARRLAASVAAAGANEEAPMPAKVQSVDDGALVGLQYGKHDPTGFKTIADGYIPIEEFTLFPKLPLEMRREVFKHILPEPQSIFVFNNGYTQTIATDRVTRKTFMYRAAALYKVPRLLQVNRETRQEVMIFHRPAFATNFGGVPIYYNRKTDLLQFDSPETLLHFYGGSAPNHLPRSLTHGFRLNMREFHTTVSQLAVGNVRAQEGMLGAVLNQMKGLKVVLIENMLLRPEGKKIIEEFCHGERELMMGWGGYTVERSAESRVKFRYADEDGFKRFVQGWKGRIISEEEEAAEEAAKVEAKLMAEAAAQRERDRTNAQKSPADDDTGNKRKRRDSDGGLPINKKAKSQEDEDAGHKRKRSDSDGGLPVNKKAKT
ncbi:hypothetical protein VTL71DRAFT_10374 [Oculimacula yallundae]|uniref:2EXR domain-containing protein n=1 Tax=Oculimacula yallundae TaxID=86028 RepID=A0ABR4CSX6_9HELO